MIQEYFEKSATVLAVKFNRMGDPVNDGDAIFPGDPRKLEAYKREGVRHEMKCIHCDKPISLHAFIAALPAPSPVSDPNLRVDPATGGQVAKGIPATTAYPKKFGKQDKGKDPVYRTVHDLTEEALAIEEGYHLVIPFPKTYVKTMAPDMKAKSHETPDRTRVVTNYAEEEKAKHDGYTLLTGPTQPGPVAPAAHDPAPSSPPPDELAFPKTYVRKAAQSADPHNQAPDEHRVVYNKDEEDKAKKDGYDTPVPQHAEAEAGSWPRRDPADFPKRYIKRYPYTGKLSESRLVLNEEEEKQAAKDGFTPDDFHPPADCYPKTFVKTFSDIAREPERRMVENAEDEKEALADGFKPKITSHPADIGHDDGKHADATGYPRTLVKFGAHDKVVHNEADEKAAIKDGFSAGVPVCPGNYILLHKDSRAIETVHEGAFNSLYERR